ncbi:hypothetical protein NSP_41510 [Nodularia spumigena CCY9414]|jgi:hypothetical protein|nr:hypothetical protein NSP_41510 [Nodularia spumigena CCY9414]
MHEILAARNAQPDILSEIYYYQVADDIGAGIDFSQLW